MARMYNLYSLYSIRRHDEKRNKAELRNADEWSKR